jgi:DNA-binding MarR family transcriptional regulator
MAGKTRSEGSPREASPGPARGAPGADATGRDAVDAIIAAWGRERPDLDVTSVGVVSRITRLSSRFTRALDTNFARHGLTKASFEALAALRRSGPPFELSQTALMRVLSLTPGTVSVRIRRLVDAGLAERRDDPEDRRGIIVRLTRAGATAFEDVVDDHLATERLLLRALDAGEQELLAGFLRRLLLDAPERGQW